MPGAQLSHDCSRTRAKGSPSRSGRTSRASSRIDVARRMRTRFYRVRRRAALLESLAATRISPGRMRPSDGWIGR